MTLIVALKYKEGSVLATDSRVMFGLIKKDQARKIEPLTENIAVGAAGLLGAIDDILKNVKDFCASTPVSFDNVTTCISDINFAWLNENSERVGDGIEEVGAIFIVVSSERIRRIFERGYQEESYDYACEGSGRAYGEYILGNFYEENLDENDAKELAVYTIMETSKMDPSVGEDINMMVFPKGNKSKIILKEEIDDITAHLAPLSKNIIDTQTKTVENIVKLRDELNNLWNKKFKFKLFRQNEMAIFQMMKLCRSEGEFTNNIAALALLIDQLNVPDMKKTVTGNGGSINILESFLTEKIKEYPTEIITNLRDIFAMRSKKFPIHVTDTKFIDVVIKLTGKYPPNWFELNIKAIDMYTESLSKIIDCLQIENHE